jgi:hypothetical protein
VLIVMNDYEVWPLVMCHCGWAGGTGALLNYHRVVRVEFVDRAAHEAYRRYVDACEAENLEAHTPSQWHVHGRPNGPLGSDVPDESPDCVHPPAMHRDNSDGTAFCRACGRTIGPRQISESRLAERHHEVEQGGL